MAQLGQTTREKHVMTTNHQIAQKTRNAIGMTTTEAAGLVHVTRRTWEQWESGDRSMPLDKFELFIAKISGDWKMKSPSGLILIWGENQQVIDSLVEDLFLDVSQCYENHAFVRSLAIDRLTKRPYIHQTKFKIHPENAQAYDRLVEWHALKPTNYLNA